MKLAVEIEINLTAEELTDVDVFRIARLYSGTLETFQKQLARESIDAKRIEIKEVRRLEE